MEIVSSMVRGTICFEIFSVYNFTILYNMCMTLSLVSNLGLYYLVKRRGTFA